MVAMATEAKLAKARSFIVCLLLMMGMVYDVYLSRLKILDRSAIVFSWKNDASLWGAGSKFGSFYRSDNECKFKAVNGKQYGMKVLVFEKERGVQVKEIKLPQGKHERKENQA